MSLETKAKTEVLDKLLDSNEITVTAYYLLKTIFKHRLEEAQKLEAENKGLRTINDWTTKEYQASHEVIEKLNTEIKQVSKELWEQKNLPHKGAVTMMKQIQDAQKILNEEDMEIISETYHKTMKRLRLALSEKVTKK